MIGVVHVTGTLVNAGAVLGGTVIGTLLGDRLPGRVRETVMHGLGLFVLAIGAFESAQAFTGPLAEFARGSAVIVLGSVLVGGVVGELVRIEDRLTGLGERLQRRVAGGGGGGGVVAGFGVGAPRVFVGAPPPLPPLPGGGSGGTPPLLRNSPPAGGAA